MTETQRRVWSEAMRQRWRDPEFRRKQLAALLRPEVQERVLASLAQARKIGQPRAVEASRRVLFNPRFKGGHHTEEGKRKLRAAATATWARRSREERLQILAPSLRALAAQGITEEHKRKIGVTTRQRFTDPVYRAKHCAAVKLGMATMSAAARARMVEGLLKASTLWFRVEYLDARGRLWRFKSAWERDYAAALDQQGLTWTYEAHRLLLSDGRTYIPDFYVVEWGAFVEIKGWSGYGSPDKVGLARAAGHKVFLVTQNVKSLQGPPE